MVQEVGLIALTCYSLLPHAQELWDDFCTDVMAQLDGASEWVILFRIIIPLSKALLAVMALYVVVGQWNSYFGPFIYLSDEKKFPLQVALRKLLTTAKLTNMGGQAMNYESIANQTTPQTLRCAAIMVTIAPIMCVYPFVQKYFVKGVMIGSIKG